MRITGGTLKGRVLTFPVSTGVRPTSSRVREALFSILGNHLAGSTWLDAFGGAGLTAIEAVSRGAEVTVFEKNGRAYRDIVSRGHAFDIVWTVKKCDVIRNPPPEGTFDIVFIDPPYALDIVPILDVLAPVAIRTIVVESETKRCPPERLCGFYRDRQRTYGNSSLTVYQRDTVVGP